MNQNIFDPLIFHPTNFETKVPRLLFFQLNYYYHIVLDLIVSLTSAQPWRCYIGEHYLLFQILAIFHDQRAYYNTIARYDLCCCCCFNNRQRNNLKKKLKATCLTVPRYICDGCWFVAVFGADIFWWITIIKEWIQLFICFFFFFFFFCFKM